MPFRPKWKNLYSL